MTPSPDRTDSTARGDRTDSTARGDRTDPTVHGDRLKLGVVVPSSNTTAEPEFAHWTPSSVSIHAARMRLVDVTVEELDEMADDAMAAADRLADAAVDAVAYACTTGSLVHGHGFDAALEDRLRETAGVPAVATALSVRRLLDAVDAHRVAVATPYIDELNEREQTYLTDAGFDVTHLDGRGIAPNTEIGRLTPEDARAQALGVLERAPDADTLFVSCTNYPTLAVVDELAAEGVSVVTSNLATLWDLARVTDERFDASVLPGNLPSPDSLSSSSSD